MRATELKGRLLVANPSLPDPNFDRTVVLMLEHGPDAALGLVLNRPSETTVAEVVPGWASLATEPPLVFVGGPVGQDTAIGLGRVAPGGDPQGWTRVGGPIGVLDLSAEEGWAGQGIAGVRIFAGYAGWGGGQLESELGAGGWFVVDASPDDAMTDDPARLWAAVLRRQPNHLRLFATYPRRPSLN